MQLSPKLLIDLEAQRDLHDAETSMCFISLFPLRTTNKGICGHAKRQERTRSLLLRYGMSSSGQSRHRSS